MEEINKNTAQISSGVFAQVLTEMLDSYFTECIAHFNKKCTRKRYDSARYFFSQKEVNLVKSKLCNPDGVIVTPLYDNGSIWCYEMDYAQVAKEKRGGKN
jgi:hypothetical protein